jgi:hypothetical protein
MIAASEFDRVVYPEYAIPTAGIIPQPGSHQRVQLRSGIMCLQSTLYV